MFKILFLVVLLVATVQHGVDAKKRAKLTVPAAHPKYSEMINGAITALKERGGSSREAIVKYIINNYKVDNGANTHIKEVLKRGLAAGSLEQVRGTGASGSFKRAYKAKAEKPAKQMAVAKKAPAKKPVAVKSATKAPAKEAPAKKPVSVKSNKAPAKEAPAKKPVAVKSNKAPAKEAPARKHVAKKSS